MMYKVNQHELVLKVAQELKNHIEMPEWAQFVKTGVHRETIPRNPDWWYIRAASILRMCHKLGPIGVSKLRTRYGGRQNRGVRPDRFALASGKVIRVILQQLQAAELIKEHKVGVHKGRITTPTGGSILAKAAKAVGLPKEEAKPKAKAKPVVKKEEAKAEETKTETPKKEAPKVEAKTETPKSKETKTETPKAEVKVEEKVETPKVEEKPKVEGEQNE